MTKHHSSPTIFGQGGGHSQVSTDCHRFLDVRLDKVKDTASL